ncbi:MAG: alpha/beta hydrolase [Campylobacter sp.]|nr:alpha/beta hydrolase [Campylobacter sp.]
MFISYKQSDKILIRKSKYTPLAIFPSQFNLPFEEVIFKNKEDISLKGWFIPACSKSDKTIMFLHGWGLNKGDILANTFFLREKGFNLFYFDFRGSGESGQGPSSIGYFETQDAQSALDYICSSHPEETKHLGIYGLSMGAAIAVYTTAHNKQIECIVAEACYYSYKKVVARWARKHKHVPYFPFVALTLFFVRKRLGIDPEDYCPKNNIKKISPRPILIITGKADTLTPRHDARALFLDSRNPKQLWLVPEANHTECAQKAGFVYQERLTEFFTKYLGAKQEL